MMRSIPNVTECCHACRHMCGSGMCGSGKVTKVAIADGACLRGYDNSSTGPWNQYLCVRSDGGLDVGLGSQVFREWNDVECFFLSAAVRRLWSALAVHAELSAQGVGPCEVTLGLVNTEGSVLGGLAEGWAEPFAYIRRFIANRGSFQGEFAWRAATR